jgi:hypothetical protein
MFKKNGKGESLGVVPQPSPSVEHQIPVIKEAEPESKDPKPVNK